jgi:hypothetical protein
MPDHGKVVKAAMALRAESPEVWDQFVLAVREYAAGTTAEMLRCPLDMLQRAQGMALQANEIATIMHEAPKLHEKMQIANMGAQRHGR